MRIIPSAAVAATAILVLSTAQSASAETFDKTFDERFEVEPGARLRLEHGDGDVELSTWDQNAIEIHVRYRAELTKIGIGREGGFDVTMEQRGDTVTVTGRELARGGFGIFTSRIHEHRYRIRAPSWVELDLEGDDGEVDLEGFAAAIAIESDDGDLTLRALGGPSTRIEMQDGNLEIDGARGELTVSSDDGDVTLRGCDCARVRIDVQDGDVEVESSSGAFAVFTDDGGMRLRLRASELDLETNDGDIRVELEAPEAALDLRARSDDGVIDLVLAEGIGATFAVTFDDGDVRVDIDGAEIERGEHRVDGSFGDGDGRIRIDTGDGRVVLRQR